MWPFKKQTAADVEAAAPPKSRVREWGEAIVVAVVLALVIRTFIVQAFKIPSGSMEDTLLIGDHLLVNKFIYGIQLPFGDERYLALRHPERGDVIVFEFPLDKGKSYFERRDFIKRVIGLPGDKIEVRDKQVYVNGERIDIPQAVFKDGPSIRGAWERCRDTMVFPRPQYCRDNMPQITVPSNGYFVMGDNRDRSYDSRFWGFVPEANIKGEAFIKYWSWDGEKSLPRFGRIGRLIN